VAFEPLGSHKAVAILLLVRVHLQMEEADYARRTERIKNLLSSYYGSQAPTAQLAEGLDATASTNVESPVYAAARRPPGTTLDSPAFNPDQHIAQMIAAYSVDKLMAEHRGMAREIKNLDSDMQQLVYENYNKFIAATDTIRAMKENVDSMEADMDKLKCNMGAQTCRHNLLSTHAGHLFPQWRAVGNQVLMLACSV
jgi:hypothetical protein